MMIFKPNCLINLVLTIVLLASHTLDWHSVDGFTNSLTSPHKSIKSFHKSYTPNIPISSPKSTSRSALLGSFPLIESGLAVAGVVAFHEAGHFLAAKLQGMKIVSFNIGYGPKVVAFNDSANVEYALRAFPVGGYVAFPANAEFDEETGDVIKELDDPDLLQNRPPWQRAIVISAGVFANFLLSFLVASFVALTTGINRPQFGEGIVVTGANDITAPAYRAGLRGEDIILRVDGEPVASNPSTRVQAFVQTVRTHANVPLDIEFSRAGKISRVSVVPKGEPNQGSIGLNVGPQVLELLTRKASNPVEALAIGYDETKFITVNTVDALVHVVQNIGGGTGNGNQLGGPISVLKAGAELAEVNPSALLGFVAALSINLGVINALPLPALDGGQLLFVLAEAITNKKLPRKVQEGITTWAFGLLFLLSISTLVGDIENISQPVTGMVGVNRKPPVVTITAPQE